MFTIVASSTTMSWARPTVPRMSHRRGSGVALARAARMTVVGAEFIAFSIGMVPRLRGVGGGRDAAPGGVGVWVVEHVACPFAGGDGQDEPGVGPDIAYGNPGPTVGGRPPQPDLDAGAGAAVQLVRKVGKDVS